MNHSVEKVSNNSSPASSARIPSSYGDWSLESGSEEISKPAKAEGGNTI